MPTMIERDVAAEIEELRQQMAEVSRRLEELQRQSGVARAAATPSPAPAEPAAPADPGLSEEEVLAISAAIAAYLGVRPHIRQIRLVSSNAWAQQGRVSIQASHRLQG